MAPNDKLVQKATATVSDLTAGGGKLKDTQAQTFIDYVVNESMMKSLGIRILRFKPEQHEFPKLAVGARVVYPATEATDPGFRRSVTTSTVIVRHDKIIIPWAISEDVVWFNVEQSAFNDHVMQMLADTSRNNFEEMCFESNDLGKFNAFAMEMIDNCFEAPKKKTTRERSPKQKAWTNFVSKNMTGCGKDKPCKEKLKDVGAEWKKLTEEQKLAFASE